MSVTILYDPYESSSHDFIVDVKASNKSVSRARNLIVSNLSTDNIENMIFRVTSESVLRNLNDFKGIKGVSFEIENLPKDNLRELLNFTLPNWITNDFVLNHELLERDKEQFTARNLHVFLFGNTSNFQSFDDAVSWLIEHEKILMDCFKQHEIIEYLLSLCGGVYDLSSQVSYLLTKINDDEDITSQLALLAVELYKKHLQLFAHNFNMNVFLPPSMIDVDIEKIPLFFIQDINYEALEKFIVDILKQVERIENIEEAQNTLAALPLVKINRVINYIISLVGKKVKLDSTKLKQSLIKVMDDDQNKRYMLIDMANSFQSMAESSNIEQVLDWCQVYFKMFNASITNQNSLTEGVVNSFSDWLVSNQPRIKRSTQNWNNISNAIKYGIESEDIVIICMIDALSASHMVLIKSLFKSKLSEFNYTEKMVFSPIPTLTEVGKNAVLTGVSPSNTSIKDTYKSLLKAYEHEGINEENLLVLKSWSDKTAKINENTKLLVLLENRIDEMLHSTKAYEKYEAYTAHVTHIINHVIKRISEWKHDAQRINRNIRVLITADHGMTITDGVLENSFNNRKERLAYDQKIAMDPDNYYFIESEHPTLKKCLIAKGRKSLSPGVNLAHGGLTPEEVMIPWIEVTNSDENSQQSITLSSNKNKSFRQDGNRCLIEILIESNFQVSTIDLYVRKPFKLETSKTVIVKGQKLQIILSSKSSQVGTILVPLMLSMDGKTIYEGDVPVYFPPVMVDIDDEASAFEDMFE